MQEAIRNAMDGDILSRPDRIHVIRELSVDASLQFSDLGYILTLCTTIRMLSRTSKLGGQNFARGGLLSGDDYGDSVDTPFMSLDRYAKKFDKTPRQVGWGVPRAVFEFATNRSVPLHVT